MDGLGPRRRRHSSRGGCLGRLRISNDVSNSWRSPVTRVWTCERACVAERRWRSVRPTRACRRACLRDFHARPENSVQRSHDPVCHAWQTAHPRFWRVRMRRSRLWIATAIVYLGADPVYRVPCRPPRAGRHACQLTVARAARHRWHSAARHRREQIARSALHRRAEVHGAARRAKSNRVDSRNRCRRVRHTYVGRRGSGAAVIQVDGQNNTCRAGSSRSPHPPLTRPPAPSKTCCPEPRDWLTPRASV